MVNIRIFLVTACALPLLFLGCEGPEGPDGADGPQGPAGEGFDVYTYVGDNATSCGGCHDATVETWHDTGHSGAYASLAAEGNENNPYCLQCHTVGFDATVAYGDTVLTDNGTNDSGFDDYWPAENDEDTARLAALENVQCEACHGPMGPTIYYHNPEYSFATRIVGEESLSTCAACHHSQIEEWEESAHGMALETHGFTIEEYDEEFDRSSCGTCHTSEGFVKEYDADWTDMERPEPASLIGCVTCHDPHSDANEHQLRNLDDVTVLYDQNEAAVFTGYGSGQLCAQCHHARRSTDNVNGQIADGYAHFGPHGSPQMDMFLGSGSYEIAGYTYNRLATHQNVEQACVSCHMELIEVHDRDHLVHSNEVTVTPCQGCHPGLEDFDYAGGQTEITTLMDDLEALLVSQGVPIDSLGSATASTAEQRMAGYAWVFVNNDGSHGVHNPAYAASLLTNAIDFITP